MAIVFSCPITGSNFKLSAFGAESVTVLNVPHPLLCASIKELAKVVELTSPQDSHILLCAWMEQLSKIGVAHWIGKLNHANFSERWHEQQLEHIINMAQWLAHNSNHPAVAIVPHVRITNELNGENLQAWRESCQDIIASYTTYFDIAETLRIRESLAHAERMLNEPSTSPTKLSLANRKLHSRRTYITKSLGLHENQQAVALVIKVCTTPQTYEVQTIQKVKEFCLDYLPENGIENYNDKQEVIHILDAAMLDKIGMAAILGSGQAAHTQLAGELAAKYSIQIDGVSYTNGAFPKINKAIAQINSVALTSTDYTAPIHTSEPKRTDFKTQLGFSIAHKQWSMQNHAKAI